MTRVQRALARRNERNTDPTRDAGITLVELLVAMILLGIVSAIVVGLFVSGTRTAARSNAIAQSTGIASNAMNEISRVIRSSTDNPVAGSSTSTPPIIEAKSNSLTLFSNIDSSAVAVTPQIVRFTLDSSGRILEERWKPTSSSNGYFIFPALTTVATSKRYIASSVLTPTAATPVFRYVVSPETIPESAPLIAPTAGLSDAVKLTVVGVVGLIRVDAAPGPNSKPVVLENTVRLPTLGFL